ncbi:MAG TPA: WYL domain-containing protein [Polyangia bacterium]|jgi:proteasome accessory factor B|nr:WYL domain-containing protein [Polyangia bacterium]
MATARKKVSRRGERYAPARRLADVRAVLNTGDGASVYDLAERFGVSVRTANRYLRALQIADEPLYEEVTVRRKVWRLMASARQQTVTLTTAQMVALFLSRRVFDFLAGTGFKEDLDEVFAKLEAQLKRKDFAATRNLGRKVFDVNEARHLYEGRIEDVNDIVTALLREERLRVTHQSVSSGKKTFVLEPYTLMVYKKGLYLVGLSHQHGEIRTFALDAFRKVDWLRGDKFAYPTDYRPEQVTEGAFGLIRGEPTRVRILFDAKVARYVERVLWHPTQKFRRTGAGLEMTMKVAATVELESWVLGFGEAAVVVAPRALRAKIAGELARGAGRYKE